MVTKHIASDPAVMAGAPRIRGTRVTVAAVLGQLGAGLSIDDLLGHYPSLAREDVRAALAFAAASLTIERPFVGS